MAERLYTLEEITGALGEALGRMPKADRLAFERPLDLFLDDVVATLKLPPKVFTKDVLDESSGSCTS